MKLDESRYSKQLDEAERRFNYSKSAFSDPMGGHFLILVGIALFGWDGSMVLSILLFEAAVFLPVWVWVQRHAQPEVVVAGYVMKGLAGFYVFVLGMLVALALAVWWVNTVLRYAGQGDVFDNPEMLLPLAFLSAILIRIGPVVLRKKDRVVILRSFAARFESIELGFLLLMFTVFGFVIGFPTTDEQFALSMERTAMTGVLLSIFVHPVGLLLVRVAFEAMVRGQLLRSQWRSLKDLRHRHEHAINVKRSAHRKLARLRQLQD